MQHASRKTGTLICCRRDSRFTVRLSAGFTLIELLIVLVILGVLATIAVPSFVKHTEKARRIDATQYLFTIANLQEKHFSKYGTYTSALTGASGLNLSNNMSPEGYYSVSVSACPGGSLLYCYVIRAVAAPGKSQSKDKDCQAFTLDNAGEKLSYNASNTDSTALCW